MLWKSHISAYARCLAEKVCGLVWSTWGASQCEDKPGARDKILKTKVARPANIPPFGGGVLLNTPVGSVYTNPSGALVPGGRGCSFSTYP